MAKDRKHEINLVIPDRDFLDKVLGFSPDFTGVDISSSGVAFCRTRRKRGKIRLDAFDYAALLPDTIIEEKVRDFMGLTAVFNEAKKKFPNSAVLGCAGSYVIVKRLSLPEMTEEELDECLAWEAEQYIPFDIKDVYLDGQIVGQAKHDRMDILLAAAKKDYVDERWRCLLQAGFKIRAVEPVALSLRRAFRLNYPEVSGRIAFINIGRDSTQVCVFDKDFIIFDRSLQVGTEYLVTELVKYLGTSSGEARRFFFSNFEGFEGGELKSLKTRLDSWADDFVSEIVRSLDFLVATAIHIEFNGFYLCGDGVRFDILIDAVKKAFIGADKLYGIGKVEIFDPFKEIDVDVRRIDMKKLRECLPDMAIVVGLSLRENFELPLTARNTKTAKPQPKKVKIKPIDENLGKKPDIKNEDLVKFLIDLAVLAELELSAEKAIWAIEADFNGQDFTEVLDEIKKVVKVGKKLSEACEQAANFPPFAIIILSHYGEPNFAKALRHYVRDLEKIIEKEEKT